MSEPAGFHYTVSDEQLAVFRSLSPARRLAWLEEAREVTWRMAPEKTRRWWRHLRKAERAAPPLHPSGKP